MDHQTKLKNLKPLVKNFSNATTFSLIPGSNKSKGKRSSKNRLFQNPKQERKKRKVEKTLQTVIINY